MHAGIDGVFKAYSRKPKTQKGQTEGGIVKRPQETILIDHIALKSPLPIMAVNTLVFAQNNHTLQVFFLWTLRN